MPFTFAHPAIVLPLASLQKKWFSITGLILGSVIPDFEYFLRLKVQSQYSHTISGVFWFDIPLALFVALIFHNIVRRDLFDNLPLLLKSRFQKYNQLNWNKYFIQNWLIVVYSIVLGAFSHILWDSFTHKDGYFVQNIIILSYNFNFIGMTIPYYKILQHCSTLMGLIIIFYFIIKLPSEAFLSKNTSPFFWIIVLAFSLFFLVIRFYTKLNIHQYGNIIVSGIALFLLSLILTTLLIKYKILKTS